MPCKEEQMYGGRIYGSDSTYTRRFPQWLKDRIDEVCKEKGFIDSHEIVEIAEGEERKDIDPL